MVDLIFALIVWIVCGVACREIAKKMNWNTVIAVIMGLLFGIFAVIGYGIIYLVKSNDNK